MQFDWLLHVGIVCYSSFPPQLSDIHLSHLEGLHSLREELEARHVREVAYLRLHHRERVGELQARHQGEVERIVSEHEEALRKLDEGL